MPQTAVKTKTFELPSGIDYLDMTDSRRDFVAGVHENVEEMDLRVVTTFDDAAREVHAALPKLAGYEDAIRKAVADNIDLARDKYEGSPVEMIEVWIGYHDQGLFDKVSDENGTTSKGGYAVVMPFGAKRGLQASDVATGDMLEAANDILNGEHHLMMTVTPLSKAEIFDREEEYYSNRVEALTDAQAIAQQRAMLNAKHSLQAASMQSLEVQVSLTGLLNTMAAAASRLGSYASTVKDMSKEAKATKSQELRTDNSSIIRSLETAKKNNPALASLIQAKIDELRAPRALEGTRPNIESKITMRETPLAKVPTATVATTALKAVSATAATTTANNVTDIRSAFKGATAATVQPIPRDGATILAFAARTAGQAEMRADKPAPTDARADKSAVPAIETKSDAKLGAESKNEIKAVDTKGSELKTEVKALDTKAIPAADTKVEAKASEPKAAVGATADKPQIAATETAKLGVAEGAKAVANEKAQVTAANEIPMEGKTTVNDRKLSATAPATGNVTEFQTVTSAEIKATAQTAATAKAADPVLQAAQTARMEPAAVAPAMAPVTPVMQTQRTETAVQPMATATAHADAQASSVSTSPNISASTVYAASTVTESPTASTVSPVSSASTAPPTPLNETPVRSATAEVKAPEIRTTEPTVEKTSEAPTAESAKTEPAAKESMTQKINPAAGPVPITPTPAEAQRETPPTFRQSAQNPDTTPFYTEHKVDSVKPVAPETSPSGFEKTQNLAAAPSEAGRNSDQPPPSSTATATHADQDIRNNFTAAKETHTRPETDAIRAFEDISTRAAPMPLTIDERLGDVNQRIVEFKNLHGDAYKQAEGYKDLVEERNKIQKEKREEKKKLEPGRPPCDGDCGNCKTHNCG